jgi:hypothetical protein
VPGLRIEGGDLRGKLIFWGGGQDRIFKKVLLFAHAVVTGLLSPPPGDSPPSQNGAIFLGIPPPGDEYPRNMAPRRGANAPGISPPFRIFAPHICDVVYSNNFVILSSNLVSSY